MRMRTVWLAVVCLLALGYLGAKLLTNLDGEGWDSEVIYAVWCISAEAAPTRADGSAWDEDGSPPDLSAEIIWRGNRVLESATSRNTLVASWDRSSLQLMDLLRTEFRPGDLDKIARIKADPAEDISVEVYDRDIFGSELIGTANVALGELRNGVNRVEVVNPESTLRSVSLQVVPMEVLEAGGQVPTEVHTLSSALGSVSQ
jgi:hypothetical protein